MTLLLRIRSSSVEDEKISETLRNPVTLDIHGKENHENALSKNKKVLGRKVNPNVKDSKKKGKKPNICLQGQ